MHQAAIVQAVDQIEKMSQFMEGDLCRSVEQHRGRKGEAVHFLSQTEEGNQRIIPPLFRFSEDMGKNRDEKVFIEYGDNFGAVVKRGFFQGMKNGRCAVLPSLFVQGEIRMIQGGKDSCIKTQRAFDFFCNMLCGDFGGISNGQHADARFFFAHEVICFGLKTRPHGASRRFPSLLFP